MFSCHCLWERSEGWWTNHWTCGVVRWRPGSWCLWCLTRPNFFLLGPRWQLQPLQQCQRSMNKSLVPKIFHIQYFKEQEPDTRITNNLTEWLTCEITTRDALASQFWALTPHLRTINIEPPVTNEVLLIKQSSVGAKEAVLNQGASAIVPTDVESLTVCVLIRVVTFDLLATVEASVRRVDEYRVVLTRHSGYVLCCNGGW